MLVSTNCAIIPTMSKLDKIKSKIEVLRDDYKNIFYMFFAVVTGSMTIIYKILLLQNPIYLIFLALFGFVTSLILFTKMMHIRNDIKDLQDKLEDL